MTDILIKINRLIKWVQKQFKINPHKHWIFLIYTFLVVVILLIILSLYLLYSIRSDKFFQVDIKTEEKSLLIKQDMLNNNTKLYNNKIEKTLNIKNGPSKYKDPSF